MLSCSTGEIPTVSITDNQTVSLEQFVAQDDCLAVAADEKLNIQANSLIRDDGWEATLRDGSFLGVTRQGIVQNLNREFEKFELRGIYDIDSTTVLGGTVEVTRSEIDRSFTDGFGTSFSEPITVFSEIRYTPPEDIQPGQVDSFNYKVMGEYVSFSGYVSYWDTGTAQVAIEEPSGSGTSGGHPGGRPNFAPRITSNGGRSMATIDLTENTQFVTRVRARDDGGPLSYSISGGTDRELFNIDEISGELEFVTEPDYENPFGDDNSYDVRVKVTDVGGKFDSQDITVNVTDIPEDEPGGGGENTGGGAPSIAKPAPHVPFAVVGNTIRLNGTFEDDSFTVRQLGTQIIVDSNYGQFSAPLQSSMNIEFNGGAGDDLFINRTSIRSTANGGEGNDQLHGGSGVDVLQGGGGNDRIWGNLGNDWIDGNDGNDSVAGGGGADTISGGSGDDVLGGGSGNDTIRGGVGTDIVNGQAGDDVLFGNEGNDTLFGEAGNDVIRGGDGGDRIHAGDGNDMVWGGAGHDYIFGQLGNDVLFGETGNDLVDGGDGNDQIHGNTGNDLLVGGVGDDRLLGGNGNDVLRGNEGHDYLKGGAGDDELRGGLGNDTLVSQDGIRGNDRVWGGRGINTFFVPGRERRD